MRWETIDQILKVVALASERFSMGYGIDQSYQHGVSQVSHEYNVAYQTIGDACRRRLGLYNIGEFKSMLKAALDGDTSALLNLLLRKSPSSYHERIEEFFSKLASGRIIKDEKQSDTFVSYTIQLRKSDSDVLKALAQLLDDEPEKILSEVAVEAVKERMKQTVSRL